MPKYRVTSHLTYDREYQVGDVVEMPAEVAEKIPHAVEAMADMAAGPADSAAPVDPPPAAGRLPAPAAATSKKGK